MRRTSYDSKTASQINRSLPHRDCEGLECRTTPDQRWNPLSQCVRGQSFAICVGSFEVVRRFDYITSFWRTSRGLYHGLTFSTTNESETNKKNASESLNPCRCRLCRLPKSFNEPESMYNFIIIGNTMRLWRQSMGTPYNFLVSNAVVHDVNVCRMGLVVNVCRMGWLLTFAVWAGQVSGDYTGSPLQQHQTYTLALASNFRRD